MNSLIRPLLLLVFITVFSNSVFSQVNSDQDTTFIQAKFENEIVVKAFEIEKALLKQSGSISKISNPAALSFANRSPVQIFNTIPGVRFEERAIGSYRIAIRGSSLRSPFGVRNVKVYWNGIPFTEPTGSTPFNLLDNANFESISVLKGPTGSVYGAGTGGTVLIDSDTESKYNRKESAVGYNASYTIGDFGMQQFNLGTFSNNLDVPIQGSVKISAQTLDGYRDQNFLERFNSEYVFRFNSQKTHKYELSTLIGRMQYGIPGGLNEDQVNADPTQARPGNPFVLGSVDANSSIDQLFLISGLTHSYESLSANGLHMINTIFAKFSDFENPFNFDYKQDDRLSYGLRSTLSKDVQFSDEMNANFVVGAELQYGSYEAQNFENDSSEVGALNFSDELDLRNSTFFLNSNWTLPGSWTLEAGVSFNKIRYEIDRIEDNVNNSAGLVIREFDLEVVPRVGLTKGLTDLISAHASVSLGFSAPTLEEIRTNEGSLNVNLKPEQGINYEIGIRGFESFRQRLFFDITAFYFDLDDAIVQLESPRGTTLFANTGSTNQWGFEVDLSYAFTEYLKTAVAYTFHQFSFDEYFKNGEDFSGNELTGVAPQTVVVSTDLSLKNGFSLNTSYNFTDEIPLDDGNTVYADPYHLVRVKAGYKFEPFESWNLEIFAGVENLLDEEYSLGNDINAFGGRFFQPSPPRNFYGGLKIIF